ncbi:MAG TPA: hypothetical protein VNQ76_06365 [Planctomicrobium sp.]|nr:hypothetical protein [Planctomicrobium sp.]
MTTPLLKWTGHPLADVGVATLCAMVDKNDPEKLMLEDLDDIGAELKSAYTDSVFVAYLSCVFPNSAYVNPTMKGASREKAMQRLLLPHRSSADEGVDGVTCIFSGEPATHLLERSQMPMLTGAGVMNYFPVGLSEMPVAAPYLLAIQALPLGGRRSEGKLLIVHCDNPQFTMQFVRKYLDNNRSIINLSQTNRLPALEDPENLLKHELPGGLNKEKRPKYPDAKAPSTFLMADLVEIMGDTQSGNISKSCTSITAYHMSNSGQGPSLAIMQIPGEFVEFLFSLQSPNYKAKWDQLVHRAWRAGKGGEGETESNEESGETETAPVKKGKKKAKPPAPIGAGKSRNDLYNDLLSIFENGFCDRFAATRFIRRHLLSANPKTFYLNPSQIDRAPRFKADQLDLIDWQLTALFLEKVLGMDKKRIEQIKEFATKLAELIDKYNDKRFYRDLVFISKRDAYQALLARKQRQYTSDYKSLPFTFDEYVDVFMSWGPDEYVSWSLIRDLISIRLVESLHQGDFFDRNEGIIENEEELNSEEV